MANSAISGLTEDTAPDLLADFLETADTSSAASKKVKPSTILGPTPNAQTGTTYTYVLADAFKTVTLSNASAIAVTIPTNASVAFPIGTKIRNYRLGAGLPTISPDSGVTLRLPTGIKPNRSMGCLCKLSADSTALNMASIAIPWDGADERDTDGFHDPASNNTQIIIPAGLGITRVDLSTRLTCSGTTVTLNAIMAFLHLKGAADGYGLAALNKLSTGSVNEHVSWVSLDVPATAADAFTSIAYSSDTSVTLESQFSYFGLKVTEINPVGSITYQYGYVTIEKIGTNEWIMYGPALG